jgi:Rho termination factor, N-terminal domain
MDFSYTLKRYNFTMITEVLQSILFATYCAVLWVVFAHFATCLTLSLCCPTQSSNHQQGAALNEQKTAEILALGELQDAALIPAELTSPLKETPKMPSLQSSDNLLGKGIRELKALASERKIRGYGKLSKAELIAVLSQ